MSARSPPSSPPRVRRKVPAKEPHPIWKSYVTQRSYRRRGLLPPLDKASVEQTCEQLEDIRKKIAVKEYVRILATYTGEKGSDLPWPCSPVECSLQGWESFGPGIIACPSCKRSCYFNLDSYSELFNGLSASDQNMRVWLVDEFRKQMTDPGHDILCRRPALPLRSQVDPFVAFSFKSFRSSFETRLKALINIGFALPVAVKSCYELFSVDAVQKALAPIVEIHKPIIMVTAVILSVHGWELRKNLGQHQNGLCMRLADPLWSTSEQLSLISNKSLRERSPQDVPYISCRECGRYVDLKSYSPLDRLEILEENERADFHSDMFAWASPQEYRFDCRTEHFSWCPWVRPVTLAPEQRLRLSLNLADQVTGSDVALLSFNREYLQKNAEAAGPPEEATSHSSIGHLLDLFADVKKEMRELQQKVHKEMMQAPHPITESDQLA